MISVRTLQSEDGDQIDVIRWDGTIEGATVIIDWVLANNGTARYLDYTEGGFDDHSIAIDRPGLGACRCDPGDWLTFDGGDDWQTWTDEAFQMVFGVSD